jgi:ABC-type multidrug transport system fused ATPase/permease subunit
MEQKLFPLYMSYIRQQLVEGILQSNSNNFKDIKSGEYISIINELTHVFLGMTEKISNKFLPLFLGLIGISMYYLFVHPYMGISFLTFSIIRVLNTYYHGMNYARSCAVRDKSYFALNEHINDTFNNSMNIHLNNAMNYEKRKNKKISDKYDDEQEEEMRVRKEITWKSNTLTILFFLITILLAYYLYTKRKISMGVLLTIAFIEIKLVGTFVDFDSVSLSFFQKFGTIIATEKFLKEIFANVDETNKKCNMGSGSLSVKNMSFRYNDKSPPVFKDLNLNISSGERVGIIGRSGSGKTTLMKILLGLHVHNEGSISVGGCNIKKIKTDELRDNIAYINQKTQLFNESVVKNIQYGNKGLTESQIINFLEKYGLTSIYSGLKKGINSNAGVNGSLLSLGMQKVTIILRGIFKSSNIVIFDEPLAGLDENTRGKIIKVINDIPKTKTIIVVTHDPEILSHLDNVYKLDELHKRTVN